MNVVALVVDTKAHGRSTHERAEVVGRLNAVAGSPADVVTVGEDGGGESGTVVAAETDEHEAAKRERWKEKSVSTSSQAKMKLVRHSDEQLQQRCEEKGNTPGLGNLPLGLELEKTLDGLDLVLELTLLRGSLLHRSRVERILGVERLVGVSEVRRVDLHSADETTFGGRVDGLGRDAAGELGDGRADVVEDGSDGRGEGGGVGEGDGGHG
jgi:hypothetical protein